MIQEIGAYAGLAAFFGLAILALLSFTQGRDLRRLREWAGSAPERDTERKEATSAMAAKRAEELRQLEEARTAEHEALSDREERRRRREEGLPEGGARERLGASRLADPRYLAAIFVVFLVIAGGVAYALIGTGSDGKDGNGKGKKAAQAKKAAAIQPSEIEVTVLNGTAVPGLAGEVGDEVERNGFSLGVVSNSTQSFTESVVMFQRGHAPEARLVAKRLGISQTQLMTSEIESLAEGATVAVIVGEDEAESG